MNTKLILTPLCLLLFTVLLTAQPDRMSKESRERIEAQRVAFITQKLELSPDEASKFWPIYNMYKGELTEMRGDFKRPDVASLSEKDARTLIEKQIKQEQHRLDLKSRMLSELSAVVSPKKVLQLQFVENMFNRELLQKLQEKRKQ